MVRLDRLGGAGVAAAGLDHIGVERALHEPADVTQLSRFVLEDADELFADPLALLLRLGDALETCEEAVGRVDVDERHVEMTLEGFDDLLGFVLPEQAVVDEDARELVPDGLVDQERGDGGVDAPGERAEHTVAADLVADARGLLLDHRGGSPERRRVGDPVEEVLQKVVPIRRVHDLGVELDAVEPALRVFEGGDRRRGRAGDDAGALGRRRHRVAVAHPGDLLRGEAGEERTLFGADLGAAELADSRRLDVAPEFLSHDLHPVTDAEHGHAEFEEAGVDRRAPPRRRPRTGRRRG